MNGSDGATNFEKRQRVCLEIGAQEQSGPTVLCRENHRESRAAEAGRGRGSVIDRLEARLRAEWLSGNAVWIFLRNSVEKIRPY